MDFLVWHWRQNQLRLKEDEVRTQKTSYSVFHFHHDSRSCGLARTWTSAQWRYGKSTPPAVGASAGVVGAMGFDDTASRGILIFLYLYISDGEFWCELDFYNWQVGIRGLSLSLTPSLLHEITSWKLVDSCGFWKYLAPMWHFLTSSGSLDGVHTDTRNLWCRSLWWVAVKFWHILNPKMWCAMPSTTFPASNR